MDGHPSAAAADIAAADYMAGVERSLYLQAAGLVPASHNPALFSPPLGDTASALPPTGPPLGPMMHRSRAASSSDGTSAAAAAAQPHLRYHLPQMHSGRAVGSMMGPFGTELPSPGSHLSSQTSADHLKRFYSGLQAQFWPHSLGNGAQDRVPPIPPVVPSGSTSVFPPYFSLFPAPFDGHNAGLIPSVPGELASTSSQAMGQAYYDLQRGAMLHQGLMSSQSGLLPPPLVPPGYDILPRESIPGSGYSLSPRRDSRDTPPRSHSRHGNRFHDNSLSPPPNKRQRLDTQRSDLTSPLTVNVHQSKLKSEPGLSPRSPRSDPHKSRSGEKVLPSPSHRNKGVRSRQHSGNHRGTAHSVEELPDAVDLEDARHSEEQSEKCGSGQVAKVKSEPQQTSSGSGNSSSASSNKKANGERCENHAQPKLSPSAQNSAGHSELHSEVSSHQRHNGAGRQAVSKTEPRSPNDAQVSHRYCHYAVSPPSDAKQRRVHAKTFMPEIAVLPSGGQRSRPSDPLRTNIKQSPTSAETSPTGRASRDADVAERVKHSPSAAASHCMADKSSRTLREVPPHSSSLERNLMLPPSERAHLLPLYSSPFTPHPSSQHLLVPYDPYLLQCYSMDERRKLVAAGVMPPEAHQDYLIPDKLRDCKPEIPNDSRSAERDQRETEPNEVVSRSQTFRSALPPFSKSGTEPRRAVLLDRTEGTTATVSQPVATILPKLMRQIESSGGRDEETAHVPATSNIPVGIAIALQRQKSCYIRDRLDAGIDSREELLDQPLEDERSRSQAPRLMSSALFPSDETETNRSTSNGGRSAQDERDDGTNVEASDVVEEVDSGHPGNPDQSKMAGSQKDNKAVFRPPIVSRHSSAPVAMTTPINGQPQVAMATPFISRPGEASPTEDERPVVAGSGEPSVPLWYQRWAWPTVGRPMVPVISRGTSPIPDVLTKDEQEQTGDGLLGTCESSIQTEDPRCESSAQTDSPSSRTISTHMELPLCCKSCGGLEMLIRAAPVLETEEVAPIEVKQELLSPCQPQAPPMTEGAESAPGVGLHLLSTIAEFAHNQRQKATPLDEIDILDYINDDDDDEEEDEEDHGPPSPDINENYNVPKPWVFESEDFRLTSPGFIKRTSVSESGEESWPPASGVFKMATDPEDMDALELDMRMRLAELQRRYKDKQRQLSRLHSHKKNRGDKKGTQQPKKRQSKSHSTCSSNSSSLGTATEPPPQPSPIPEVPPSPQPQSSPSASLVSKIIDAKKKMMEKNKLIVPTSEPIKEDGNSKVSCRPEPDPPKLAAPEPVKPPPSPMPSLTKKGNESNGDKAAPKRSADGKFLDKLTDSVAKAVKPSSDTGAKSCEASKESSAQMPLTVDTTISDDGNIFEKHKTNFGLLAKFASDQIKCLDPASQASLKVKKKKKKSHSEEVSLASGSSLTDHKKKRKLGHPKKFDERAVTETIVAKKPKSFNFFGFKTSTPSPKSVTKKPPKPKSHSTSSSSKSKSSHKKEESSSKKSWPSSQGSKTDSKPKASNAPVANPTEGENINGKAVVKPKMPHKEETEERGRAQSFSLDDWQRRRSERIFLNEAAHPLPSSLHSPSSTCSSSSLASSSSQSSKPPSISHKTSVSQVTKEEATKSHSKPVNKPSTQLLKVEKKPSAPLKPTLGGGPPKVAPPTVSAASRLPSNEASAIQNWWKGLDLKNATIGSSTSSSSSSSSKVVAKPPPVSPPLRPGHSTQLPSSSSSNDSDSDSSSDGDNVPLSSLKAKPPTETLRSCVMTKEDLVDGVQILFFKEGLFYEATVKAIQPPDIYGVIIDGERGNRPHILPQEELLKEGILDVTPSSRSQLVEGVRVCAYWSQKFTCLYPGTISKPSTPNPEDLISVEFDDGDSGSIALEHIRMLPQDFPVQEDVETIPLVMAARRKSRATSEDVAWTSDSTRDRRPSVSESSLLSDQKITRRRPSTSKAKRTESSTEREEKKEKKPEVKRELFKSEKPSERPKLSLTLSNKPKDKELAKIVMDDSTESSDDSSKSDSDSSSSSEDEAPAKTAAPADSTSSSSDEMYEPPKPQRRSSSSAKKTPTPKRRSSSSGGKRRDRQPSSESKMAAFLPARQLWHWMGPCTKRPGAKGRAKKEYYKSIKRGKEILNVGDCAVFLSTGRPNLPYVGRIESLWEGWGGQMAVKVKWFYHPEETKGGKKLLEIKGALYQSPHEDENDVQTISHKCQVLSYSQYKIHRARRISSLRSKGLSAADLEDDDVYYLAGTYEPTIGMITFEDDVRLIQ